ncbi:MAG: alpha/beta fold hydrolase [Ignavibacteriaceae bacterium]
MKNERNTAGWLVVDQIPANPKFKVLLIPGLMGSDFVFSKLMKQNSLEDAGVHLIAGNPPGFKGNPLPGNFDFRISSYAELVESVCEAEKIDLVLGHSFGANVLIEVAFRRKYRGKVMLISPSLNRDAETKDMKMLDTYSRKKLLKGLIWTVTYASIKSAFAPYFKDPSDLATVTREAKLIPKNIASEIFLGYFNYLIGNSNLAERLIATTVPVYYLRGDKDDIGFTQEHKDTLAKSNLVSLYEIPDAHHFAMADNPAEVARLMIQMLNM